MNAASSSPPQRPIVLGIESSCDDTAVAIVAADGTILADIVVGQNTEHAPYGGVVPEIAARAHSDRLSPMVEATLAQADLTLADIDAIAATAGPGLIGGVMVGLVTGKALAYAADKLLIAVNHLEGHALSPRLAEPGLEFPYLLLLVSGGHTQILQVDAPGQYRRLATTIDDAVGEAFDKAAKILGLGYPGGPLIEALAKTGDETAVPLPRPLAGSDEPHFSFAGLKSAVLRASQQDDPPAAADIAASFQRAAADCLIDRTARAMQSAPDATALVVAGGVAANAVIRSALTDLAKRNDLPMIAPPARLCTDNAAMIAWAGIERLRAGLVSAGGDPLDTPARPRWPLDPDAEAARGAGYKA
ncbi:MAG: tRNA (adenosine(37)-N6)-threonylcarbamoyltransferase complex transferase subunit TsaD [Pacificimonas sp.]|jgi:N6-L-threonylcarbamoyladenine synthase|nr:tRNA (adenosine(37)-N6)-threonylcarbamoyltransferase complex transferase subunit TsaD [Pacificimonas sp.]